MGDKFRLAFSKIGNWEVIPNHVHLLTLTAATKYIPSCMFPAILVDPVIIAVPPDRPNSMLTVGKAISEITASSCHRTSS